MYTLLVFTHLLSASMALGAIVATDLRLLSKLSQDKIRIAPPNPFVARIVMVALLLLWVTGGTIVWLGVQGRPDYLQNPKLIAKIGLVVLLSINAFVLHHVTFPRLARGRRVARWTLVDWVLVGVPVGASNFLWMFAAFLGVARAWNDVVPLREVLEIAAAIYLVVQVGVFTILATAGRSIEPDRMRWSDRLARSLAAVGSLGTAAAEADRASRANRAKASASSRGEPSSRPGRPSSRKRRDDPETVASQPNAAASLPPALSAQAAAPAAAAAAARPALRLVDTHPRPGAGTRPRAAR